MITKTFYIKNMVCDRCLQVVRNIFLELPCQILTLELGKAHVKFHTEKERILTEILNTKLKAEGFELVQNRDEQWIEQIKTALIQRVKKLPQVCNQRLSQFLVNTLHRDYAQLSKLFSKNEHITIERYYIKLKIERAKELVQNGQGNFTTIAYTLNYSSLNHLSTQFKQETGQNLSAYNQNPNQQRLEWDKIV